MLPPGYQNAGRIAALSGSWKIILLPLMLRAPDVLFKNAVPRFN